jgi:hypothetical protein
LSSSERSEMARLINVTETQVWNNFFLSYIIFVEKIELPILVH